MTTEPAGMSPRTTDPAPITQSAPILVPMRIVQFTPKNVLSPTWMFPKMPH
jgi:hypothetical protein